MSEKPNGNRCFLSEIDRRTRIRWKLDAFGFAKMKTCRRFRYIRKKSNFYIILRVIITVGRLGVISDVFFTQKPKSQDNEIFEGQYSKNYFLTTFKVTYWAFNLFRPFVVILDFRNMIFSWKNFVLCHIFQNQSTISTHLRQISQWCPNNFPVFKFTIG